MAGVLGMQEQARLHSALYALRVLARKYEFRDETERAPMGAVVEATFPSLLRIFQVWRRPFMAIMIAGSALQTCKES